ncbi:MAG: hypothetical protein NUV44_07245 [Candidatus Scalindua sp.]|nr:hypothetical protein [Candidatus Scalindua sp.]
MTNRSDQVNSEVKELNDLIHILKNGEGLYLGLLGSACHKKLDLVGDLDVLIVVENMNKTVYQEILKVSRTICTALTKKTGRQWGLEDRQSPLKPEPHSKRQQLHLCLHDKASIIAMSLAMSLLFISKSRLIWGMPLASILSPPRSAALILKSCLEEVKRAKDSLRDNLIITRYWDFSGRPCIISSRIKTEDKWLRRCLLRNCSGIADRVCIEVLSFFPDLLMAFVSERPTIYKEIENDLKNWNALSEPRWNSINKKVQILLDEHILWLNQALIVIGDTN